MSRTAGPARAAALAVLASALCLAPPMPAGASPLLPQTKLRLTLVQWVPARGEYASWDAIGGDFQVSAAGTLSLPLIGTVDVSGLDEAGLAAAVERRLKDRLGLVALPDATVEVVELPPVYVVGWVAAPGSFPFRDGLTVLQALALGGGVYREPAQAGSTDAISRLGDLKSIRSEILYALGRQARLRAEQGGQAEIAFPAELTGAPDAALARAIAEQETLIFRTRADGLARQLTSLTELQALYAAEIDGLEQKGKALDRGLKTMQDEFAGVEGLVRQGVATVSRRSELERALLVMQSQRLDQATAIIRARQSASGAVRDALGLKDQRRMEAASQLQETDTRLEGLRTRLEVAERLLLASPDPRGAQGPPPEPGFAIVRKVGAGVDTLPADEASLLRPGDVLKVSPAAPPAATGPVPAPALAPEPGPMPFGGEAVSDAGASPAPPPALLAASPAGPAE